MIVSKYFTSNSQYGFDPTQIYRNILKYHRRKSLLKQPGHFFLHFSNPVFTGM